MKAAEAARALAAPRAQGDSQRGGAAGSPSRAELDAPFFPLQFHSESSGAEISKLDIASVIDQNELKQGRLTAGTDIPVVSPEVGLSEIGSSDAVLLLAWNFEEEIVGRLRSGGFCGDIIVPLPRHVRVL